jgi:uncharacterized protein (DUF433 family)
MTTTATRGATLDSYIEITPGVCGGKPRIAGRRITVQNIALWNERMGMSADEIATDYDLSLAEVHAALAYYFDHREEIEKSIREGQAFAEEMRQKHPSLVSQKLYGRRD